MGDIENIIRKFSTDMSNKCNKIGTYNECDVSRNGCSYVLTTPYTHITITPKQYGKTLVVSRRGSFMTRTLCEGLQDVKNAIGYALKEVKRYA